MALIDACKLWLSHMDPYYVSINSPGDVRIVETEVGGRGTAVFNFAGPSLSIRSCPGSDQIRWLRIRKCADGAILHFTDKNEVSLHIAELKGRVNDKKWSEIQEQIEGMYLNALACAALMGIDTLKAIICYVAFTTETISPANSASSVLLKRPAGARPRRFSASWTSPALSLPNGAKAVVVKMQRDSAGDVDFGAC